VATGYASAGCSNRRSSKAAASEEARRTLQYVESLSAARTPLDACFSILLEGVRQTRHMHLELAPRHIVDIAAQDILDHGERDPVPGNGRE